MVVKDLRLPWDYFLEAEIDKHTYSNSERRAAAIRHVRMHIEAFRDSHWHQIVHELANKPVIDIETGEPTVWNIPDDLEPHWVASGRAVYWQQDSIRRPERIRQENGSVKVVVHWDEGTWHPTSGLPANNASQVANFLGKGLRLRPPGDGVTQGAYQEPALLSEGTEEPSPYFCNNHPKGSVEFPNWKAYLSHCRHFMELPTATPPQGVLNLAKKYDYYCYIHYRGFYKKRHATQHIRDEMTRRMKAPHPSLEEMERHNDTS